MRFYQIEKNLIKTLSLEDINMAYALEHNNNIIGYGLLTTNSNNIVEIIIKEEYRSNGYGKYLFGKMLEELKKQNYKDIKLTINKENYRMKNIIIYYGGQQLCTLSTEEMYILPIK